MSNEDPKNDKQRQVVHEPLTDRDQRFIDAVTRAQSNALLADHVSRIQDKEDELRALWRDHERRWGPELDETVRAAVEHALRFDRKQNI